MSDPVGRYLMYLNERAGDNLSLLLGWILLTAAVIVSTIILVGLIVIAVL